MTKILVLFISTFAFSQSPVLFFSDITSGPNSGWSQSQPGTGCAVTIWGQFFGGIRNGSFVTANGNALTANTDYAEWGVSKPNPHLQRITFWVNDKCQAGPGEITVTVAGQKSNALPFTIRPGNIRFVSINGKNDPGLGNHEDPWKSPLSFFKSMMPGDIGYFREGVYDKQYAGGHQNFYFNGSHESGTPANPIAWIGYPGETPTFDAQGSTNPVDNINGVGSAQYFVFSKFAFLSYSYNVISSTGWRVVGNDCQGLIRDNAAWTGVLNAKGKFGSVLGNAIHGGTSGSKMDHAVYVSGCPDSGGIEVAWNYIYDNQFDRGPWIVLNHQEDRCPPDRFVDAHRVHHNFLDCRKFPSRGIGTYDLSWDPGEAQEPEPAYIYNNLLVGCGMGTSSGAIYHHNGHAFIFNNTLVNTRGRGIHIYGADMLSAYVANNIIHMDPAQGSEYLNFDGAGDSLLVTNNLFYGLGPFDGKGSAADANNVNEWPGFSDTANLDFTLRKESPAVDKGTGSHPNFMTLDYRGLGRAQAGVPDIGAFEYIPGVSIEGPMPTMARKFSVEIFPNPIKDLSQLRFKVRGARILSFSLFDALGRRLLKNARPPFRSGVFLVEILTSQGKITRKSLFLR